jgi:hypothetical protein
MNAAPSCHRSPTAIPAYRISGSPDLILAYFTFGALTREIGTKMKTLIQKGSFGGIPVQSDFGFAPGFFRLTHFARIVATTRRVHSQVHMSA